MTFAVFADGTANLPQDLLGGIQLLPIEYTVNDNPQTYWGDIDRFNGHAYYEGLRRGNIARTSLLNTQLFLSGFTPVLEEGMDVVYICMSSTISGTYNSAVIAARELMEQYPKRLVHVVDSRGCGFGIGMLALQAAELSQDNICTQKAVKMLEAEVPHICQYFTVEDLKYLKNSGRVSARTARIAMILGIKPILYGDSGGSITACEKVRGRARSIEAIAKKYKEKKSDLAYQRVFISHGDCLKDAEDLASLVKSVSPDYTVTICQHEPVSGAHVGPGMLALFFRGNER